MSPLCDVEESWIMSLPYELRILQALSLVHVVGF